MIFRQDRPTTPLTSALSSVELCRDLIAGLDDTDVLVTQLLQDMLQVATSRIVSYLNYDLERVERVATYNLTEDATKLSLACPIDPSVTRVDSLNSDGAVNKTIAASEYNLIHDRVYGNFTEDRYRVTYTAGYTAVANVIQAPHDLEYACRLLVAELWHSRGRSLSVTREELQGVSSVSYKERPYMPDEVLGLLEPYLRRGIIVG